MYYAIYWNGNTYLFDKITEARLFAISKIKNRPANKKSNDIQIMRDDGWRFAPEELIYAVKDGRKWVYLAQDDTSVRGRLTSPYTINKNGAIGHPYLR